MKWGNIRTDFSAYSLGKFRQSAAVHSGFISRGFGPETAKKTGEAARLDQSLGDHSLPPGRLPIARTMFARESSSKKSAYSARRVSRRRCGAAGLDFFASVGSRDCRRRPGPGVWIAHEWRVFGELLGILLRTSGFPDILSVE
jgi:hypothetical protein